LNLKCGTSNECPGFNIFFLMGQLVCGYEVEPVPATGRWRLMLFDHDTEVTLLKPSVSHQFQLHWNRFLPPGGAVA
jgi:hypothetical protein